VTCPVCGEKLREIERQGIMVDICPGCKGVWLDRGELDKLLEMGRQAATEVDWANAPPPPPPAPPDPNLPAPAQPAPPPEVYRETDDAREHWRRDDDDDDDDDRSQGRRRRGRRDSWFESIFEIFGD
jgi:Zn-finger nucleic acid-binding protein